MALFFRAGGWNWPDYAGSERKIIGHSYLRAGVSLAQFSRTGNLPTIVWRLLSARERAFGRTGGSGDLERRPFFEVVLSLDELFYFEACDVDY